MTITTLGIDLGKTTFHVVGTNRRGTPKVRKQCSRAQLLRFTATLPACLIGLEACPGAHALARELQTQGHTVKLMAAQFVKPYVKTNKSDFLDAEAIAEAVTRPTMRFVPIKTVEQQELQALHRLRDRLITQRTGLINQTRAFLLEQGIAIRTGPSHLRRALPLLLDDATSVLSERMRRLLARLLQQWQELEQHIAEVTAELEAFAKTDPLCQLLLSIPGVGPLVSTALVAAVGNGTAFRRGRDMAAWLGLVPRQHSTGGKARLLGISKRGNPYLRRLFIHGARSVFRNSSRRAHRFGPWLDQLQARVHQNVAVVALANKLTRIAWAVLTTQRAYQPQAKAA